MHRLRRIIPGTFVSALLAVAAAGCGGDGGGGHPATASDVAAGFAEQAAEFRRGVVEVADGVHVAIGYGLGNSVMLVGDDAVVIVDTMESAEAAAPVLEEFRRISDRPVAAIVYTHNHADHVFGAGVFAADDDPEVIAHATMPAELERLATVTRAGIYRRSMRQFGTLLPAAEQVHCGIGPRLLSDATTTPSVLLPTTTFDGRRLEITRAGIRMVLLHLPGETPDQIAVWLPDQRVLLPGDNYYHSFPNLYAIRGTGYRDVMQWVHSLDAMRALGAEVLVPAHTMPVIGKAEVRARLTDYRDAIQFVHDQTVRGINRGLQPDELVRTVRLPEPLASRPWLAEHYGRVDWSVRSIFDGYLGWFGGDAADLSPLSPAERATRVAALGGGAGALLVAAERALEDGDPRWALELAGHLAALGERPEATARVRAAALRALAEVETSANGRNYYLTQAGEAEGALEIPPPDLGRVPVGFLDMLPIESFLRGMTVSLDPDKAAGKVLTVGFRFRDVDQDWGLHLRNGVLEIQPEAPAGADMTVTTDTRTWKEILTRRRNATAAFVSGDVEIDRNRLELVRFLLLFR